MRWVLLDAFLFVAMWPLYRAGFNPSIPIVVSESMVPFVDVGDITLAHNHTDIRIGDVVVFKRKNKTIVHRVVRTYKDRFVTRGDANDADDPGWLRRDQIQAKIVFTFPPAFRPLGKALKRFLENKRLVAAYSALYAMELTDQMRRWLRS